VRSLVALDWPEIYAGLVRNPDDPQAWASLEQRVRQWAQPALWQLGWHMVDDAVADTCSSALIALSAAKGADTFAGFVYGHYLNVRRRVLASVHRSEAPLDALEPAAPIDLEVLDERVTILRSCLEALPGRDREAIRLRYFEECSAEKIAAALNVSVGNARRIVFNGLARLRRCMKIGVASTTPSSQSLHSMRTQDASR
jgi:RNA polymerase sigma factor (sigma-70 family)